MLPEKQNGVTVERGQSTIRMRLEYSGGQVTGGVKVELGQSAMGSSHCGVKVELGLSAMRSSHSEVKVELGQSMTGSKHRWGSK